MCALIGESTVKKSNSERWGLLGCKLMFLLNFLLHFFPISFHYFQFDKKLISEKFFFCRFTGTYPSSWSKPWVSSWLPYMSKGESVPG